MRLNVTQKVIFVIGLIFILYSCLYPKCWSIEGDISTGYDNDTSGSMSTKTKRISLLDHRWYVVDTGNLIAECMVITILGSSLIYLFRKRDFAEKVSIGKSKAVYDFVDRI